MPKILTFLIMSLLSVTMSAETFHRFKVKDIDGKDFDLASLKGKVVLVVNVASKCGLTPQYKDLQYLYEKYKSQGLEIVAFPANNFGKQEPGSDFEIKQFCTSKYNVTFKMMSKIDVRDQQAEVYKYLTNDKNFGGKIKWNFEKFLIGADGKIIGRYSPKTKPKSKELLSEIEKSLAKLK